MWRIHQIFKQLCLLLPLLYSIPVQIDGQTVATQTAAAAGSPLISGQRAHQQSVVAMPLPAEDNFEEIFAKNFGPPPPTEGESHQDVLNGDDGGNEPQEEAEHVHGFDKIDAGVEAAITSTRPPTLVTQKPQKQEQKIVALEIQNGTLATASALDVPPLQFDEKQPLKKPPPPSSLPPAPSTPLAPENAIPEFPPSAETIQQPLCPISVQMPTFLRHQWLFGGQQTSGAAGGGGGGGTAHAANFVRKMDSLEACARLCRENVEPFGGRHFGCHGFTYLSHKNAKNNICEFFDDHLAAALEKKPPIGSGIQKGGQGHLAPGTELPSSSSPRNYFERICLPLSSRCSRFPFSFEVYPRRSFVGVEPIQSEEVDDRERCLEFCLQNERCRSVDFDTENLTCHLYAQTQHWTLGANDDKGLVENLAESVDLDHYENTCLLDLDRCGSRHLAFVLIRNAELAGFSVALGNLSASLCLTRCLDSPPAFCRSVQFRPQTSECLLGTDRPHSPIPSDDMDIFEPICLPDPPSTSTLECLGEHVFERIPSMELRAEGGGGEGQGKAAAAVNEGTDIPGLALEECLDACILDETCQSLNYRAASAAEEEEGDVQALCRLFPFNRADNRTLPVLIQNVDYYEMACSRIFFTTNPANRTHQTETTITTKLPPSPSRKEKEEKKGGGGKQQQQKENKDQRIALESVVASVNGKDGNGRQGNGNNAGQSAGIPENEPKENLQQTTKADAAILAAGGGNQNCTASKLGTLLEAGRVLRMEHRIQHHVNVRNLEQCQRICIQAKAFHCATFAYSQKSRDCILSSIVLTNGLINSPEYGTTITQKNPNFDLYTVREELKCVEAEAAVKTTPTTPKILTTLTTILTAKTTKTTTSTARTTLKNAERIELENEQFRGEIAGKSDRIEPPNPSNPQFTDDLNPPVVFTEGASIFNENFVRSTFASTPTTIRQKVEETTARTTEESIIEKTRPTTELPLSKQPSLPKEFEEEPLQTQKANNINAGIGGIGGGVGGRLSPHQVHAAAFCDSQGVNVTFRLIDGTRYSGAVYAADRFTQCRLFVEQQSQFAFFVNRPNRHLQNWCNAQEIDGQLSVMLVLSNDQGVPLEITTKDDLFFYISCNYGAGEASPFRDGIVVSGLGIGADLGRLQQQVAQMEQQNQQIQQQQQMMEKRRGEDKRVKLKIVRNGMPVSNVYIGEQLVAIVESNNLNAGTFRVAECNATRVPPASDKLPPINLLLNPNKSPNSIPLLDHRGCSLLPEIMGSMRRVGDHMEAPLTAFRIDGSNELDIICSVIICRVHCVQQQPEQCERPTARFGRMSGKQLLSANSDSLDDEGDKITVDQRIRVLVMKDEEADETQQSGAGQPTLTNGNKKGGQQQQLNEQQKKRLDLSKAIFDEQREEEAEDEGGRLLEGNPTLGGGSFKASNGDICLNPLLILLMVMLFVLAITALFVSLLTHWCRRKNARTNFYPTSTFSTELSSHHFHIPRILDRAYMG